jgi:hypothetical protein
MHSSDGRFVTHSLHLDRREEFTAVLEAVLPSMAARLEALALYAMVAAFWGVVVFVALTAYVHQ